MGLLLAAPSLQAATKCRPSAETVFGALRFNASGIFQISIFEDLHFGEDAWESWGPEQDVYSVMVINEVLDAEPNTSFVVINGDLITGENTFLENSTTYVDEIVAPLLERNLTWASTYGNHDSQYNLSSEAIFEREHLWPNSRTQKMVTGPNSGVSNYYLPVYGANCTSALGLGCTPELLLWFFDSRGGYMFQELDSSGNQIGQPDWVDTSVVNWFTETRTELSAQYGKTIPSLGFVHIPTNASLALQQELGVDANRQPGINDDNPLAQQGQGWCTDDSDDSSCVYGGQDVPFMEALVSTPGLMAVFSGHDHGDSWCYKWNGLIPGMTVTGNGINLCFGQHSGYGGYGDWIRGSRQIVVSLENLQDLTVDTYIRLETGEVAGYVSLNSTYGLDEYPATPDTTTELP
ncbi:Metallo-dependent phosphatase-like protein [Xylariales sp. PMI_506]|nr:Metallo-dependent phosphatase-like protein [Xylariales sp. PMI_506]